MRQKELLFEGHESAVTFALKHMTHEGMVTMTILVLMALASWTVIVGKILALRKAKRLSDRFYEGFGETSDPFELVGKEKEFEGAPPFSVYDYACREMQKQLERFAPKSGTNGSRRAPRRVLSAIRAAMAPALAGGGGIFGRSRRVRLPGGEGDTRDHLHRP